MSHDLDSMESILLDDLASTVETIRLTDLRIRESVESGQWGEGRRLSMALMGFLKTKRISCDAISQKLIDLSHTNTGCAVQIQRCSDMSMYLLSVLSKHLPVYQRIVDGLVNNGWQGRRLWVE